MNSHCLTPRSQRSQRGKSPTTPIPPRPCRPLRAAILAIEFVVGLIRRHSPSSILSLLFTVSTFFVTPPARAHDPFEAFHSAKLHSDRLELVVTMAQSTALKLIDPTAQIASLTLENLAAHRPRLVREAAMLFILTSVRQPLVSRTATVELTDENDLIFRVTYPRPAPGKLYFSAAYLRRLGDGYGVHSRKRKGKKAQAQRFFFFSATSQEEREREREPWRRRRGETESEKREK